MTLGGRTDGGRRTGINEPPTNSGWQTRLCEARHIGNLCRGVGMVEGGGEKWEDISEVGRKRAMQQWRARGFSLLALDAGHKASRAFDATEIRRPHLV